MNHLQIKTLLPLHINEIAAALGQGQRIILIENNQSGQFARHLRAETGIVAHGHIRKYDGEPIEPKHIVAGVKDVMVGSKSSMSCRPNQAGERTIRRARAAPGPASRRDPGCACQELRKQANGSSSTRREGLQADVPPDWCPGCGDFAVLSGLFQACADLQIQPHALLVVSGIGCSSNSAPASSAPTASIAFTVGRCPLRLGASWLIRP